MQKKNSKKFDNVVVPLRNDVADSISDRYVNLFNVILAQMRANDRLSPVTLLTGASMGMMALLSTMPEPRPETINDLELAIVGLLAAFLDESV